MDSSQRFDLETNRWGIPLILTFILSVWAYFSFHNWISDSEFWPVTLSGHFEQWKHHPALVYKFFFHASLGWIYALDLNSADHLRVAKAFYSFLGVVYFLLFYGICEKNLGRVRALLVLMILMTSSLGFSQVGVIRSDFLSSFFVLLGVFFYLSFSKINSQKLTLGLLGLSLVLLLISPKSVLMVIPLLLALGFKLRHSFSIQRLNFLLFLLTLIAISLLLTKQFWSEAFFQAWRHQVEVSSAKGDFLHPFLLRYLTHDALLFLAVGGVFVGRFWQAIQSRSWGLLPFSMGILFSSLFYNPKLPFFFGSYFPLFLIGVLSILKSVQPKKIFGFWILFLVTASLQKNSSLYFYSNRAQLEAIESIEQKVAGPEMFIFDGLGLFPRSSVILSYIGPGDFEANLSGFQLVSDKKPDLIIYTARLNAFLEPRLSMFLREHYTLFGPGFWKRKDSIYSGDLTGYGPAFSLFTYFNPEVR